MSVAPSKTEWLIRKIPAPWNERLKAEFTKSYFPKLAERVFDAYACLGDRIYPTVNNLFRSLELCPDPKLCILAQDPYVCPDQADGLAFSVRDGIAIPPSLYNIFLELGNDTGIRREKGSGNLQGWATQGILLLNTSLTVKQFKPNSHEEFGWELFTDAIIDYVNSHFSNVVFMLWGAFAKNKRFLLNRQKHLVLLAAHPSPKSASNGYFGCKHFSAANTYLLSKNKTPIDWNK